MEIQQICNSCGKVFKRLNLHKCKQNGAVQLVQTSIDQLNKTIQELTQKVADQQLEIFNLKQQNQIEQINQQHLQTQLEYRAIPQEPILRPRNYNTYKYNQNDYKKRNNTMFGVYVDRPYTRPQ